MKIPEDYIPRAGDTVLVRAKVRHDFVPDDDTWVHLKFEDGGKATVPPDLIAKFLAREWEVGDPVMLPAAGDKPAHRGRIIGVDGELVWFKPDDAGAPGTYFGHAFVAAPEPSEPPAAPAHPSVG